MRIDSALESPELARRIRISLTLMLIWAIVLFLGCFPQPRILKHLPAFVGWPLASYACWGLRSYSKSAKLATIAAAVVTLLSILRALMPTQTLYSASETIPEVSIPLLAFTVFLGLSRDFGAFVAMAFMGRLVTEVAEPVDIDQDDGSLVEKSERYFRRLVIGWIVAMIWSFAIAFAFILMPNGYGTFMDGLPSMVRRLGLAGPAIIRMFVSWNIVLLLYPMIGGWKLVEEDLRGQFE